MRKLIFILFISVVSCAQKAQITDENKKIEYLSIFAKVYGYVKYFHPSDEADEIDWGAFAAYGSNLVEQCKSKEELIQVLNTLFKPIAPSIKFNRSGKVSDFKLKTIIPEKDENYELTYWQHNGVSSGMDPIQKSPYKSYRVNSIIKKDFSKVAGKLTLSIDANKYIGKKIKYKAWAKKGDEYSNSGYIRLQLNKTDGTSELKKDDVINEEWQEYEIISDIDSLTTSIKIGFAVWGKGSVFFDSAQLSYQDNDSWIKIEIPNSDFEKETKFSTNTVNKWYHDGLGHTSSLTSKEYYGGSKSGFLEYTGTIEKVKRGKLFSNQPGFGEIIERQLGSDIYCQIPSVLYISDEGTFPKANLKSFKALKDELKKVQTEPTYQSVRIGNIINVYNVFQHFYPYFDVVDVDWNQELKKALEQSFDDVSGRGHLITLQKFTAPLRDGHIAITYNRNKDYSTPSITWEWIEGELVITNVLNRKIPLKVGDIVTHIEGESTIDYFDKVRSRISAGTEGWLNYRAEKLSLEGEQNSELNVVVNNQNIKLIRDSYPYNSATKLPDHKKINDSVYFLNLNTIAIEDIKKVMSELVKSKSIICDLRVYPKGNHEFLSHLLKENDTTTSWMQIPQIVYPDREKLSYQKHSWRLPTKKPYLGDKQIIFIIKGRAISYAESYTGYIKGYKLATVIGQPTAGTNGNVNSFELPGGYSIRWTGMKVVKHDGSQLHGIGFIPDIYVNRTIKAMKEGRDEYLEKAIELTKQK